MCKHELALKSTNTKVYTDGQPFNPLTADNVKASFTETIYECIKCMETKTFLSTSFDKAIVI